MQVRSLGQEDPLEKEIATQSRILAWEIPWTEEPGGYSPWGCEESDTAEHIHSRSKPNLKKRQRVWVLESKAINQSNLQGRVGRVKSEAKLLPFHQT